MIGALVAILSLNLTANLVGAGIVARTLPVTGATAGTPITVVSPGHNIPSARFAHGVVSGIGGVVGSTGTFQLNVVDEDTFTLWTYTAGGKPTPSTGTGTYTSGGQIRIALPDGCILLGRRNVQLATSVATPRYVFVPTDGKAWGFEPYGGQGAAPGPAGPPPGTRGQRGTAEQQAQRLNPQLETEFTTFEVYVTGAAPDEGNALSPDFGDFDATQKLVWALYEVMFDGSANARAKVLKEGWPSQSKTSGTMSQRGQMWAGIIEFQQAVTRIQSLDFVPVGTNIQFTVIPINGGSGDATVFTVS